MAETEVYSGPLEPDLDHTSGGKWSPNIHFNLCSSRQMLLHL